MTANPEIADYKNLEACDAKLFVQSHFERFKSWLVWSAPGGLAKINLAENDSVYDQFIEPELASLIDRKAPHDCFTFINTDNGRIICIVDAFKFFEIMEASNG